MIILISILIFAFIVSLIFVFVKRKKIASKFLLGPSARYEIRFHKVKEKRKRYHPHIVYGKKPLKLMRNVNEKHDLDHKNRTRENVSYVIPKSTLTENPTIAHERKGILFPAEMRAESKNI